MGDTQEIQLHIRGYPNQGAEDPPVPLSPALKSWKWWLIVALNISALLAGQTAGTLLGQLYYVEGGNSKWMATLVASAGAPLLAVPLLFAPRSTFPRPPLFKIALIYSALGLLIAGDNLLYSCGLLYLPVSTYSLVCATQLAFNSLFSYFLNGLKFTPPIFNSVVLLTFSAALLGVNSSDSQGSSNPSRGNYPLGFVLTVAASATLSLVMSLTQLTFQTVLKSAETFTVVLEMQMWTNIAAAVVTVAGLFASGEWRGLGKEMDGFGKGRLAYVMTLAWTAISWQVCSVGIVGLIFMVSSLFCNVIGTLGLPLVPVFAVAFFGDRMDGVKVMAMLIAVWGFLSYMYQHYLDGFRAMKKTKEKAEKLEESTAG